MLREDQGRWKKGPVQASFQAPDPQEPDPALIASLRFDGAGLIPAVAQDWLDGAVLMVAWMNREALERTLATGQVHYWSRSRSELWHKGATSGHIQTLRGLRYDCDADVSKLRQPTEPKTLPSLLPTEPSTPFLTPTLPARKMLSAFCLTMILRALIAPPLTTVMRLTASMVAPKIV